MQDSFAPGLVLDDRFRVERSISLGGWGEVYRGTDVHTGQPVAIKRTLPIDPNSGDEFEAAYAYHRFLEEARVLLTLDFPGIPKCLGSFSLPQNRHCLVMEFIEGMDLERHVQDHLKLAGSLPPASNSVEYVIQACKVLEYLHDLKPHPVVHRDVKPSNLILRHQDGKVYLVDFGFARPIGKSLGTKTMVGTIGYAPIEQCQGNPGPLSDLYALGATLHYLLTGRQPKPFDIEPLDQLRPDLPSSLVRAVATATRNDREQRFTSVASFRRELERLLPELEDLKPPDPPGDAPPEAPAEGLESLLLAEDRWTSAPSPDLSPPWDDELPTAVTVPDAPVRPVAPWEAEPEEDTEVVLALTPPGPEAQELPPSPRDRGSGRRQSLIRHLLQLALVLAVLAAAKLLWSRAQEGEQLSLANQALPGWSAQLARGLQTGSQPATLRLQANNADDTSLMRLLQPGPSGFISRRPEETQAPSRLFLGLGATDPARIWLYVGIEGESYCRLYRIETMNRSDEELVCNVYDEGKANLSEPNLNPPLRRGGQLLPNDYDILHCRGPQIELRASNINRLGVVLQSCASPVIVRIAAVTD